ncbi:MAG: RNA polymerase sigma factor [Candidatus Lambdaproteobacteria bacterium]|nr:RNA polymerase sigma factor [Candidatus Lambdaproteobacteria bacterium]
MELEPLKDQQARDAELTLMRRVAAGDPQACAELVDQHLRRVTRFAYRMLGSLAEAEDLSQEVFLRLWRHAGRWEPRARLATWLHRVAYNLCLDVLRRRRNVALDDVPEPADPGIGPADALLQEQIARAVEAALARLPERQRAALVLVHYEGLSGVEAAEALACSEEALESLLARGRRTLRQRLANLRNERSGMP